MRNPFTNWGWYDDLGHDVLRDALIRWYGASPARQAMVANRDERFFDVAAVAVHGHALACSAAFNYWAKNEIAKGATHPTLRELAASSFEYEWELAGTFGAFLREAGITLPGPDVVLAFYAVEIAREICGGLVRPITGAATLVEIGKAQGAGRCAVTDRRGRPLAGSSTVPAEFEMLAKCILPGTFEPSFDSPVLDERIRTEAHALIEAWSARVVTSDDPKDWRSRL
ncbi:MAG: hypothetical protein IT450_19615 [Phycisphaerales bacterium]|nr:hypothetical protein [Phycisphaerales bacterium]